MAKAVFITSPKSIYDDFPEKWYHFPHTYLNKAHETVGDWIVYYETGKDGGRQVYFATARVAKIEPDPQREAHYYAHVDSYLELPNPVPLKADGRYLERALENPDGSMNLGLIRRAIHHLEDREYTTIVQLGTQRDLALRNGENGSRIPLAEPETDYGRPVIERLTARPFRDAAFAAVVRQAYDCTCALTGLKLINGGGRCEIEAAHIRPVEEAGPDSPRNGLALSRTAHWLFDRGLVSLEDDGRILVARQARAPTRRLLNPDGCLHAPENRLLRPHPQFLRWHRERKFKE